MATFDGKLEKQMKDYIDALKPASDEFISQLKITTPLERYRLLMKVRGNKYRTDTCLIVAAYIRDLPAVKCMLDIWSQSSRFNILKIANNEGCTALRTAVTQRMFPYSSALTKELTNDLGANQLYELLAMKTKRDKRTVFHLAVYLNRADFVAPMLDQLANDHKVLLFRAKDATGATPAHISVPAIFSTIQGLDDTKQKLKRVDEELVKQEAVQNKLTDRCRELERHRVQQTQAIAEQTWELRVQKRELSDQCNGLREAQQNVERIHGQLVIQEMIQDQLSDRCKELERYEAQEPKGLRKAQQQIKRVNGEQVRQEKAQSKLSDKFKELEAHKVQNAQELREVQDKVMALHGKVTELERLRVHQDEVNEGQTRKLTVQNVGLTQLSQKYTELKQENTKQTQAMEGTNKVLTDLQQHSREEMEALENQNILQTEVIASQRKYISIDGQIHQIVSDKCERLERQKQEQEREIAEQMRELNEQKKQLIEQSRDIQEMKELLAYLQKSVEKPTTPATGD